MRSAGDLHAEIVTVCPIIGVDVGDPTNRATWRFTPDPSATQAQITAGQNVINTFDMTATSPDTLLRNNALAELLTFSPATMVARNGLRVLYALETETRNKINEMITAVNSKIGSSIQPLVNHPWQQLVATVKQQIQQETDPST